VIGLLQLALFIKAIVSRPSTTHKEFGEDGYLLLDSSTSAIVKFRVLVFQVFWTTGGGSSHCPMCRTDHKPCAEICTITEVKTGNIYASCNISTQLEENFKDKSLYIGTRVHLLSNSSGKTPKKFQNAAVENRGLVTSSKNVYRDLCKDYQEDVWRRIPELPVYKRDKRDIIGIQSWMDTGKTTSVSKMINDARKKYRKR
jgi:hypothetical protein